MEVAPDWVLSATSFHVGNEALAEDDDETTPLTCPCAACGERARMRALIASAHITRLTSICSPRASVDGGDPWTVYVVQAGHVAASGRGATEEEALHEALRVLGVVS